MHWIFLLTLTFIAVNQVRCSGLFEVRLKSFTNENGKDNSGACCSGHQDSEGRCIGTCRTRFRVCLKHYQKEIDTTTQCTFGDVVTPVLGDNSINMLESNQEGFINPIQFPFGFTWPETFSLIVEAWHDSNDSTRLGGSEVLISRLSISTWLAISANWTEEERRSAHAVMLLEYRVICDKDYYGSGCANVCRPKDNIFGHFTCSPTTGEVVCLSGWQGDYCTKPRCLPGCDSIHGHCTKPNECICHPGWKGPLCDECERYPGCIHGTCQEPWKCDCKEGWGGLFCNQDLNYCTNHKPCKHGGTCFNTGQGSYTCSCPTGFTGTDCERKIDDCALQPCKNGGSCKANGNRYRCECPKGWHGEHCELSAQTCDEAPCKHGATCHDNPTGYTCSCALGYSGTDCENQIDDCVSSPCVNGGSCTNLLSGFQCSCPSGYAGTLCEINIDDCKENLCLNGGSCVDLVNNFRCQCVPGYVGKLCENKVDLCVTKPCANGGMCTNLNNDYRCKCRPGFTGKDCSIDVDECRSSPCRNGGTCVNRVNSFQCVCVGGFRGPQCEEEAAEGAFWNAGNLSRHVSEGHREPEDEGLSTEHVVVIATVSTAVPLLVLVAAVVVMCLKQRRKREKTRADDEARMQNEQNAVQSSMAKRGAGLLAGDAHMIKNTWGKCINNVANSPSADECSSISVGMGGGLGNIVSDSDYSTLHRACSQKQLNTDPSVHRASQILTHQHQHHKEFLDKRISVLSDSSLCNTSDVLKRPLDKAGATCTPSSVYVIDEHFCRPDPGTGTFATQV